MTELGTFLGRFHPLVVHLPIGILLITGVLEALARTRRFAAVRPAVGPTLVLGAASAVIAVATGWLLGEGTGYAGDTYTWHLRMGIGVAIGAVLTAATYHTAGVLQPAYPVLLVVTLLHVAIAGHLGGTLTHGEGYLAEYAPAFLRGGGGARANTPVRVASETVVYDELVHPLLQARCGSCHGAQPQGGLRLDSAEGLQKGGDSGPVVVAGRAGGSELVRRIWLPPSHKEAMPPRGSRPLTLSEGALLRWWVEEGASFDATLADLTIGPEVLPAIEARLGPIDAGAPAILAVHVPPADQEAVARLRAQGVGVTPLAESTQFLHVHTTNVRASFGDAQLELLAPVAPQVTWLSLAGTQVTDDGLAVLARFPNLTRLHLDGTSVTDAGLAHLAGLERLEYLNLHGTGVTDAGLQYLGGLPALRALYLWKTRATPAGIERLRAERPRLKVEAGLPEGVQAASSGRDGTPAAR